MYLVIGITQIAQGVGAELIGDPCQPRTVVIRIRNNDAPLGTHPRRIRHTAPDEQKAADLGNGVPLELEENRFYGCSQLD
jgi:hypothetical protein